MHLRYVWYLKLTPNKQPYVLSLALMKDGRSTFCRGLHSASQVNRWCPYEQFNKRNLLTSCTVGGLQFRAVIQGGSWMFAINLQATG